MNITGGAGAEFIHSIFSDGKFEKMLKEEFEKADYPVRRIFDRAGKNGKDYYYMHRETGFCRMTIVEYDFVDGPNAEKLKDKKYREGMYECVVRAVCRQEGKAYKPVEQPKPKPGKLYKVQVFAGSEEGANKMAERLRKDGYPVYIIKE